MAKPPAWMEMGTPYFDGDTMWVNVRVRPRHPSFLRYMWGVFRKEIRRQGHHPNSPRMLWVTVYHLVKILVKAEL